MQKIFTPLYLFILASCGQNAAKHETNNEPVKNIENWKKLEERNCTIQYPPEWESDKSGVMGTTFVLFAPMESNQDKFRENINLLIQNLPGTGIDLDKYVEISEKQIKSMVPNSALIESKRVKRNSTGYHRIIYTGDRDMFHLKFEQYYWVTNNKAYALTLTCEQSKFSNYQETGEKILNTFIVNK